MESRAAFFFRLTIENANDDHIGKEIGAGKGSNRSRILRRLCWSRAVSPSSVSRLPEECPHETSK